MKTIGLIGGMSWESSLEYYKLINEGIKRELGSMHSGKSIMYTVDFAEIENLQHHGEWEKLTATMIDISKRLEKAGSEGILICTNTMHLMADDIQKNIEIPIIHIADSTAEEMISKDIKKVGLLGTKFTMEKDFYKGRIQDKYGIEVIVPDEEDRKIIHDIIYQELVQGKFHPESKGKYIKIMKKLTEQGAEGVILACTEIPLLVKQEDFEFPIFDTTAIHVESGIKFMLGR